MNELKIKRQNLDMQDVLIEKVDASTQNVTPRLTQYYSGSKKNIIINDS